jgi:hypothetical protein
LKRLIIFFITIILSTIGLAGCNQQNKSIMSSADLETHYETLDSIINDADLIAEVKVKEKATKKDYNSATFMINQVQIKEVIIGDSTLKGKEINLLELGFDESDLNIVKNNKKYLIFLTKYEGPITDDAYVVTGVYQGKFKINTDESLEYAGELFNGVEFFQKDFKNMKLSEAKEKIKKNKESK